MNMEPMLKRLAPGANAHAWRFDPAALDELTLLYERDDEPQRDLHVQRERRRPQVQRFILGSPRQ